jgi:Protein of unknown function (DUF3617)
MRTRLFTGLILTSSVAVWAADKVQPLNVKAGLWEVTTIVTTSGELPIPAALLEKLTPEQRARIKDRIDARKSEPARTTIKEQCLTRKQLDSGIPFSPDRKSCTRTVLTSTGSKVDVRVECLDQGIKTDGIFQVEALSSGNVKGAVSFSATGGDGAINSTSIFTAKWIGPSCSPTK